MLKLRSEADPWTTQKWIESVLAKGAKYSLQTNRGARQTAILNVDTSTQKDFHRAQIFDNRCHTRFLVLTLS